MFAHSFPFDPTYGYDSATLAGVPPADEPRDFAKFWRETFVIARSIPSSPDLRPSARQHVHGFDVFDVSFNSLGNQRIHGWLSVPRNGPVTRGIVVSHGYGGRDGPDQRVHCEDAVAIYPCARGISASGVPEIPSDPMEHVLTGIESRETYVHRGCAADVWAAATALIELFPMVSHRLDYLGASFGGGIGALALPWDNRFKRAFLAVPSFGQYPIRLTLPSIGSGEAVRRYVGNHPAARDVLAYYDASVAAKHLRIPTLVAAALFDPAVPPPGQFAVYHGLAGPKHLLTLPAAHFAYPGEAEDNEKTWNATARFLRESP